LTFLVKFQGTPEFGTRRKPIRFRDRIGQIRISTLYVSETHGLK
jgi:hypothetical protein